MTKVFPKSRICVIDCYTSFEAGLRKASDFSKKHNISLNSSDGKKLILSFCLKHIEEIYNKTNSHYPKVLCISKKAVNKKIANFVENYFDKMMTNFPAPYCGKYDLDSPDLETAAENSLTKLKSQKSFKQFLQKLNVRNIN